MAEKPLIRIVTHDGPFHADDVVAVAILAKLFPDHQIIRSRDPDILEMADFLVDVGGVYDHDSRKYDHHMQEPPKDRNNHLFSSAGLIWNHYSREYLRKIKIPKEYTFKDRTIDLVDKVDKLIETKWIYPIDRNDNGVSTGPTAISELISAMNPVDVEKSRKSFDRQFMQAVSMVSHLFERACFHAADSTITKLAYMAAEKQKLSEDRILFVDAEVGQFGDFSVSPVHFVIYPTWDYLNNHHDYIIRPIYRCEDKQYKTQIPTYLFGLERKALEDLGFPGIAFIHHTGFKVKVDDKQTAIDFCERLLAQEINPKI